MWTYISSHSPRVRSTGRATTVAAALAVWLSAVTLANADSTGNPGRMAESANVANRTTFLAQPDETPTKGGQPEDRQASETDTLLDKAREIVTNHLELRSVQASEILLASWEDVTRPDSSLGCPKKVPRYNACVVIFPVSKYRLQRIVGGDTVLPLGEMAPNATSFTDRETRRNTTYTYRLVAVNAVGESPVTTIEVSVP